MRFPAERYSEQISDRLSDQQAFALENLSFVMREADWVNLASLRLLKEVDAAALEKTRGEGNAILTVIGFKTLLRQRYSEERILLERGN